MIPHNLPTFGAEERGAAERVIRSGWVAQGSEVAAFENDLCTFFNLPEGHSCLVSSGSAALYLALFVLGGSEKRIGLPVYACSALRNAVGLLKASPVYFDCGANSPNLDLASIDTKNIDILVAPSIFGIPIKLPCVNSFKVVEDIAQAMGAISSGHRIGLRGDIGICSFYATKMMTSGGQGGALVSYDKSLIEKLKDYRNFDARSDSKLRFNFQLTDMQAAIGREQLKKLPEFIFKREKIFSIYRDAGLDLIDESSSIDIPVRYRSIVRCKEPERVIKALYLGGIRSIIPVKNEELLDAKFNYPNAFSLTQTTVSLPCYPELGEGDALRIAQIVKRYS